VRLLVASGGTAATVNALQNHTLCTPLLLALGPRRSPELVKFLADSGADVNASNSKGETPSMLAMELPLLKLLLEAGAAVNATSADGSTALHYAAKQGVSAGIICCLLKAGADAAATDSKGLDAAAVAAERGHAAAAALLQRAADDQRSKQQQQTAAATPAIRLAPLPLSSTRFTSAACDSWRSDVPDRPVREQNLQQILQSVLEQCPGASASQLTSLYSCAQLLEADMYSSAASCSEYFSKVAVCLDAAAIAIANQRADGSNNSDAAFEAINDAGTEAAVRIRATDIAASAAAAAAAASSASQSQRSFCSSTRHSAATAVLHKDSAAPVAAAAAAVAVLMPAATTADTTAAESVTTDSNSAGRSSIDKCSAEHLTAAVPSDDAVKELTTAPVSGDDNVTVTAGAHADSSDTEAAALDVADATTAAATASEADIGGIDAVTSDSADDTTADAMFGNATTAIALQTDSDDTDAACDTADDDATATEAVCDSSSAALASKACDVVSKAAAAATSAVLASASIAVGLEEQSDTHALAAAPVTNGFDMSKFRGPPGSWKCDACFVRNDASSTRCQSCEVAKPADNAASNNGTTAAAKTITAAKPTAGAVHAEDLSCGAPSATSAVTSSTGATVGDNTIAAGATDMNSSGFRSIGSSGIKPDNSSSSSSSGSVESCSSGGDSSSVDNLNDSKIITQR
jgi:Ankyrin repeats (3 copies)